MEVGQLSVHPELHWDGEVNAYLDGNVDVFLSGGADNTQIYR